MNLVTEESQSANARYLFLLQNVHNSSGAHPASESVVTRSSFPGDKAATLSTAEVESNCNYNAAVSIHLHRICRDILPFLPFIVLTVVNIRVIHSGTEY
jgi:hypothetical protein